MRYGDGVAMVAIILVMALFANDAQLLLTLATVPAPAPCIHINVQCTCHTGAVTVFAVYEKEISQEMESASSSPPCYLMLSTPRPDTATAPECEEGTIEK